MAVIAGRLALNPWWGEVHNRHLVFFPAIIAAALFGGFGPGAVATAIASAALARFWPGTGSHIAVTSDLVLFFAASLAVCALIDSLRLARVRAEQARKSREQVMQVVAHDLRNPLSSIKIMTQALRTNELDPELLARALSAMDGAIARMESLIRDIVDTTKIEHGELKLRLAEIDAVALVRECVDGYAPLAQEKQISLELETPAVALPLRADRERLLQALGNLVGNALKFTPKRGRVTLRLQLAGGWARFEVRDTGPGIPDRHLPHLFEAYWKGEHGGTGLGLFIAAEIVRAHGGRLRAQNAPGGGACFAIDMPDMGRPLLQAEQSGVA
jgi:signal transduction histidine kinase